MEAIDPQKARAKTGADLCSASIAWSIARNGSTASCTAGAALASTSVACSSPCCATGRVVAGCGHSCYIVQFLFGFTGASVAVPKLEETGVLKWLHNSRSPPPSLAPASPPSPLAGCVPAPAPPPARSAALSASLRVATITTESSATIGALRPLPPEAMYGARVIDTTCHPSGCSNSVTTCSVQRKRMVS